MLAARERKVCQGPAAVKMSGRKESGDQFNNLGDEKTRKGINCAGIVTCICLPSAKICAPLVLQREDEATRSINACRIEFIN